MSNVKKSYEDESKIWSHGRILDFSRKALSRELVRTGVALHFGAQELLEVQNVLLPLGFSPDRIYSMEREGSVLERQLKTIKDLGLGIPENNFLLGNDYEILEKIVYGKIKLNGPLAYCFSDFQGPMDEKKIYYLGLIFGNRLLASGGVLGTNFLAGREVDKGEKFWHVCRSYRNVVDLVQEQFPDFTVEDLDEDSLMEARSEGITRFLHLMATSGKGFLTLDDDKKSFYSFAKGGSDLLRQFDSITNSYERFDFIRRYALMDNPAFYAILFDGLRKKGYGDYLGRFIVDMARNPHLRSYYPVNSYRGAYLSDVRNRMLFDIMKVVEMPLIESDVRLRYSENGLIVSGVPSPQYFGNLARCSSLPPQICGCGPKTHAFLNKLMGHGSKVRALGINVNFSDLSKRELFDPQKIYNS